jgi:hypothetical protein
VDTAGRTPPEVAAEIRSRLDALEPAP